MADFKQMSAGGYEARKSDLNAKSLPLASATTGLIRGAASVAEHVVLLLNQAAGGRIHLYIRRSGLQEVLNGGAGAEGRCRYDQSNFLD